MGLDDHRTAGGQRGRGVAARHREGEREVAGGEVEHRSERHLGTPQLGSRPEREIRVPVVDPHIEVRPVGDHVREQLELHRGPLQLTGQSRPGQTGLGHGQLDQLVGMLAERVGGRDERPGPDSRIERGVRAGGGGRAGGDLVDVVRHREFLR